MQGDPSMFPDVPDGSTAGYCAAVQCMQGDPSKVKVVKPRTNVLTERSHFCLLIPVDVMGLGHTTLSIPHLVRSNVVARDLMMQCPL